MGIGVVTSIEAQLATFCEVNGPLPKGKYSFSPSRSTTSMCVFAL